MQLADTEWLVMQFVWEHQPVEAADVIEALGKDNRWTDATVKTLLHRLVKKGALQAAPVGKKFRYQSAVKRQECIRLASRSFLDRVFRGDAVPALLHFVKDSKLSESEVRELQRVLDLKLSKLKGSKE